VSGSPLGSAFAADSALTFDETPAAIEQFTGGTRGKIVISFADGH
jgi:hypothetical protein